MDLTSYLMGKNAGGGGSEPKPKNYVIDITKETIEDPEEIDILDEENISVITQYVEEVSTNTKTESKLYLHLESGDIEAHITLINYTIDNNTILVQTSSITETDTYKGYFYLDDNGEEYYIVVE